MSLGTLMSPLTALKVHARMSIRQEKQDYRVFLPPRIEQKLYKCHPLHIRQGGVIPGMSWVGRRIKGRRR